MANSKKEKHKCPPLPEGLGRITPAGWNGESPAQAKAMWYAWLRVLNNVRPLPRKTY